MDNQERLAELIYGEYTAAKSNQNSDFTDFEALLDMLELNRTEKDYEWLADYFLPEMPAMVLTDASNWANQYFQSRDFVDVFLESEDDKDKMTCKAIKKLINKTFNNDDIYYFQKYMRMRLINALAGYVWLKCWWEYDADDVQDGVELKTLDVDVFGQKMVDPITQTAATQEVPRMVKRVKIDRFNFDVIDPRNVFTDDKYCYSAQQKDWVIVKSEMCYDELVADKKKNGYITAR